MLAGICLVAVCGLSVALGPALYERRFVASVLGRVDLVFVGGDGSVDLTGIAEAVGARR